MSELPKGWVYARLPDLVAADGVFVDGDWVESKDQDQNGDVRLVQLADIGDGWFVDKSNRSLTQTKARELGCTFLAQGDVLIARMPDPLGRACIFPGGERQAVTVVDVCIVRGNPEHFDNSWLMHFINAAPFRADIHALQSGSTRKRISRGNLSTLNLPVPPRVEQTRIVAKLEELISDLDAGVAELKAAQKKLAQYRQSLLKAAVENDDFGTAFPKLTLGELVKAIGQGWSPKCKPEAATNDEQWAVMKTTAIQPLDFDGTHNKLLPSDLKPRQHLELRSGDLLVTRAGPRNRVGISCLVRSTRPKLILCDKAYRIKCDETRINPEFLELVLNAPHIVQRIDELKTGISDSGLNLTQDRFFTLEIPIPSLEAQQLIIEKVKIQVESIRNQEKSIELSLKQSTAQRQNILRAAFAGELVPQDPNDEPASLLLERIRAERAAQAAVKKPHGRKTKELV